MPSLEDRLRSIRLVRYLWAVGSQVERAEIGTTIADRYEVIAPHIWVDRHPDFVPVVPEVLPDEVQPYLKLIRQPLHIPQVFGFCDGRDAGVGEVMLLENAPIDANGQLYPTLESAWPEARPVRQAYWLSQLLDLWQRLASQNLAASLLDLSNLRVQGWRVWLVELRPSIGQSNFTDFIYHWRRWLDLSRDRRERGGNHPITTQLIDLCQSVRGNNPNLRDLTARLDRILLDAAARQPLQLASFGLSDSGPSRLQNEDSCYPVADSAQDSGEEAELRGTDRANLAILCDGVGGHEGGEVASELAVRTLKLQIETFSNIAQTKPFIASEAVCQQLSTMMRVTNNTIAQENDRQDRYDRERMGTTAVMAWQFAQSPPAASRSPLAIFDRDPNAASTATDGDTTPPNTHELYIANVGDSRAYWISANYCQQLTVDDDLATQEVAAGHCLYREALQYEEAAALTQAIGTRDGTTIKPDVRRFIVEEDGVLLLCSDGVSDNDWVESSWQAFVPPLLAGETTLEATVRDWLEVTNEYNGHDNATIVLIDCRVSERQTTLEMFETGPQDLRSEAIASPPNPAEYLPSEPKVPEDDRPLETLTDSSRALLSTPAAGDAPPPGRRRRPKPTRSQQVLAVLALVVLAGLGLWLGLTRRPSPLSEPEVPTEVESTEPIEPDAIESEANPESELAPEPEPAATDVP